MVLSLFFPFWESIFDEVVTFGRPDVVERNRDLRGVEPVFIQHEYSGAYSPVKMFRPGMGIHDAMNENQFIVVDIAECISVDDDIDATLYQVSSIEDRAGGAERVRLDGVNIFAFSRTMILKILNYTFGFMTEQKYEPVEPLRLELIEKMTDERFPGDRGEALRNVADDRLNPGPLPATQN